jgi:cis-L-3-hydroxyproline dehydratase
MAAWDLFARIAAQPLANILGSRTSTSAPLYRSISQAAPDVMANQARGFVDAGYRRLQVKVGGESKEDVERLVAVRACVPPDVILYADANGAWFLDEAMRFVDATRNQDYYLEQPCISLADNAAVSQHCHKPMVLDEGISIPADLLAAHQLGIISGVTLKLARVGGITNTRLLRDMATALGLKVTIEDTGGSAINTAATAHLMCSTSVRHQAHTVDFMNWVTVSNATGMPPVRDGRLNLPDGPGLGVTAEPKSLGPPVAEYGIFLG